MNVNLSKLSDTIGKRSWVDPIDICYFIKLHRRQWWQAKLLAKRDASMLAGSSYAEYIKSYGPVEKAGEFIAKEFLDYHCVIPYIPNFTGNDIHGPSFSIGKTSVSVYTRMLKLDEQVRKFGIKGRRLSCETFLLMVSELGLSRRSDVYVFCGFDVESLEGYAFGWTTAEVLGNHELRTDVRCPAKCMLLPELYDMGCIMDYCISQNG